MTCDVEFLAVVNEALSGARFDSLVIGKFQGSLHLSKEESSLRRYRIDWAEYLFSGSVAEVPSAEAEAYEFAPLIAPMIDEDLIAIRHINGVYELVFSSGRSVFAGKHRGDRSADNVLIVTALDDGDVFTWGILD
ncbi:hypothetical protein [Brevundimonas diminuta]|uniref:hypothetical protein n=1 Tax=Brevundimonas diminuta TaxID=293 RepID=UPI0032083D55